MKIIIVKSITFPPEINNPYNMDLWKSRPYGYYDVTWLPNPGSKDINRMLFYYGIDKNLKINNPIPLIYGLPFNMDYMDMETMPTTNVVAESQKEKIVIKPVESSSITGDTLLKAIAIAQNPELALQLLNK